MNTYPKGIYRILVYLSYLFFILFGSSWLVMSFIASNKFNFAAFFIVFVYVVQAIWRNKLANLIIGIISLFVSILFFLNMMYLYTRHSGELMASNGEKILVILGGLSIIFSGILIFSYMIFNKDFKQ